MYLMLITMSYNNWYGIPDKQSFGDTMELVSLPPLPLSPLYLTIVFMISCRKTNLLVYLYIMIYQELYKIRIVICGE